MENYISFQYEIEKIVGSALDKMKPAIDTRQYIIAISALTSHGCILAIAL